MRRLQPELFNAKMYPFLQAVNLNPNEDTKMVDVMHFQTKKKNLSLFLSFQID